MERVEINEDESIDMMAPLSGKDYEIEIDR